MEIAVNDGEYMPVTEETIEKGVTPYIDMLTDESAVLKIRKAQTADSAAGRVKELTIYPRRDMTITPAYNQNTYVMTNVNSLVQYRVEGGEWQTVSQGGKQINLLSYAKEDRDTYVDVRMKAETGKSASKSERYTIKKLEAAPAYLKLNYQNASIDGFKNGIEYQYKKTGNSSWATAVTEGGSFDIAGHISAEKEIIIQIREKGTDIRGYSAAAEIECSRRPAAPKDITITYGTTNSVETAHLTNVDSTMEYKIGTGVLNIVKNNKELLNLPDKNTTVYVRYMGTEETFPSLYTSVALKAKRTAPSVTYNSTTEVLSGLKDTMEYSAGGDSYTKAAGTTLECKAFIDRLGKGESKEIKVRYAETETQPVSKDKVITLYGRADAPTGLVFDKSTNKLNGIKSTMQYREKGTQTWKSISSGSSVTLTKLINGRKNVQLEVRYKATAKAAASEIVTINLY